MSEEDLREIRKTLELIRKSLGWIRWIVDIILIVSVVMSLIILLLWMMRKHCL